MTQREGRLVYRPGEWYALHGILLREGDPLDMLVGKKWVACHVHYEASDGHWYCDAGIMSIPLYDGREARFRLELVRYKQSDEDDLMLAALVLRSSLMLSFPTDKCMGITSLPCLL